MELPIIFSALLLSSSPAIADDFLYVSCEMNGTNKVTALPSGKLISERPLVVNTLLLFKIDLTNNKMRSHTVAEWVDIRIKENQIIQDDKVNAKGFSGHIRGAMPLNPPGPVKVHNWFKTMSAYNVIKAVGECREIDSSIFDEASKE